ncbi:MAG: radical SAM protein [Acidobacteriaceae bacterium]
MQTIEVMPDRPVPLSLIAEVTHHCPLHCLYCSNPLELKRAEEELPTGAWKRVFVQAAALGAVHLHLTGGEPLARKDLPELVRAGRDAGLYVNMITSGIGSMKRSSLFSSMPAWSICNSAFRI